MQTTLTELPESRARVEVEVPAEDVGRATSRAARALAREMRLPGFRKGKAPPSLVIRRLGFPAVLEEAIRETLPEWYEQALLDSGIAPIGDPSIEMTSTPEGEGEPLGFRFEVGVRPVAELGQYKGLEVGRREAEVPDEVVERELERLRQALARLEPVERAAREGDVLLIDFEGTRDGRAFEGGKAEDYLLELGTGGLLPGFEEQLAGAEPGQEREVKVTFPGDHPNEDLAGADAVFAVKVKEVREKILPDLDDDFAAEVSEFDTLEELREDIRKRAAEAREAEIDEEFRLAAVDAAVAAATVEVPDDLVTARAAERWERMERRLAQRGIDPQRFVEAQGKTREQLIEESKPEAERELMRAAVVTAVAAAEGIEVSEEELLEALEHSAEHERTTPEKLLKRLRASGRDALVAEDIRSRKAIELVAEAAKPIPLEEAEERQEREAAAERIWTPEKEAQKAAESKLWTPEG